MIQKNERRSCASDLSDSQWAVIAPMFPRAGNRSKWEKWELVNAVLYFVENGCKWRNLPHDFPPYTTVANFYYAAIRSGLWEEIRAALVERMRTDAGRNADPSYAIINSQSVKTTSAQYHRYYTDTFAVDQHNPCTGNEDKSWQGWRDNSAPRNCRSVSGMAVSGVYARVDTVVSDVSAYRVMQFMI